MFASKHEYISHLDDLDFWWPYLAEILNRHDLLAGEAEPVAGVGGTYPTYIYDEVVVKLFGRVQSWCETYKAERAAHALIATNTEILAPRVLAEGAVHANEWPYLITTRMRGRSWSDAAPSKEVRLRLAGELGRQMRRVHSLPTPGIATDAGWPELDVMGAAKQSSLPALLIPQIDEFLERLEPFDRVFVHSDVTDRHVFVKDVHMTGIIDWGDAMVTDRHYELIKFVDLFDYDKELLGTFLDASEWPMSDEFPRLAMGHALYRQAQCLATHLSSDAFHKLPTLFPVEGIETLDELAVELFAVD